MLKPRSRLPEKALRRELLLTGWGAEVTRSDPQGLTYLRRLSPAERYELRQFCTVELAGELSTIYREEDLPVHVSLKPPIHPDLPPSLAGSLLNYQKRQKERLELRIRAGRNCSDEALRRVMAEPLGLAQYLAEQGIDRWELMTISHQVSFLEERPHQARKLKPFLKFLERGNRFPRKAGPKRRTPAPKLLKEAHSTPFLSSDELTEAITKAKQRLSDIEFLFYCMVARIGLTAKAAYDLTLNRVKQEQNGSVYIRPVDFWLKLPPRLGTILAEAAKQADPQWPYEDPDKAPIRSIFGPHFTHHYALNTIMERRSHLLRTSAILAAMRAGKRDRSFLRKTIGVSSTTVVKLEFLLPADLHSLLPHDLVKERNKRILGDG